MGINSPQREGLVDLASSPTSDLSRCPTKNVAESLGLVGQPEEFSERLSEGGTVVLEQALLLHHRLLEDADLRRSGTRAARGGGRGGVRKRTRARERFISRRKRAVPLLRVMTQFEAVEPVPSSAPSPRP
mmetsp:Transcript_34193/g.114099  ORF Transcript_34193/g.114099 Transcript_34193/m.114099 type:complete len:130 (-) Transcript_34193:878-1267(-)